MMYEDEATAITQKLGVHQKELLIRREEVAFYPHLSACLRH